MSSLSFYEKNLPEAKLKFWSNDRGRGDFKTPGRSTMKRKKLLKKNYQMDSLRRNRAKSGTQRDKKLKENLMLNEMKRVW